MFQIPRLPNGDAPILVVIGGPTAVGKTNFAIECAQKWNAEIISADSRQFYREMSIGTAKPSEQELNAVKHHFIDNKSIFENYSSGRFATDVLAFLDEYFKHHRVAVMCGGSGLFIRAVCDGMDEFPEVPLATREAINELYAQEGISVLQEELAIADPVYYAEADLQNPARLIRALEVCRASGLPYSSFRRKEKPARPFQILKFALDMPRETLYERIDKRVIMMLEAGLVEEAQSLYPNRHLHALQTVGYSELFDYFDEKIPYEEAVRLIQQNSRHYAKRQLTWFRRESDINWLLPA